MKNVNFFLLLVLLLTIISCKSTPTECRPEIPKYPCTFDEFFPKHPINFQRIMGDTLLIEILDSTINLEDLNHDCYPYIVANDTLVVLINYNKKSKKTTLINFERMDTLFIGFVSYYRGLYYFSQKVNDSSYWIGAMDIGFDSVCGLSKVGWQMCDVDRYIEEHPKSKIISIYDTTGDWFIRLKPEKKSLRDIYSTILASYPTYRIISNEITNLQYQEFEQLEEISNSTIEKGFKLNKNKLIESCFPNPASDYIQLEFSNSSEYTIQLINLSGEVVLTKKIKGNSVELDLSKIKPGAYILRVYSLINKTVDNEKILVR